MYGEKEMKSKLSKSILATGLAAASFVVGANHVKADTIEEQSTEKNTDTSDSNASTLKSSAEVRVDETMKASSTELSTGDPVQPTEVTETLVQFAKEKVEESQKQISEQTTVTEGLEKQLLDVNKKVEEAQNEVERKNQDVLEATPEGISAAKKNKEAQEIEKVARQEEVSAARKEELDKANEVEQQRNVVNAAQTLVDMAKEKITEAEKPIQFEKTAVESAKITVQKAAENVTTKEQELKIAEQSVVNRDQQIAQAQQKVAAAQNESASVSVAISQKEAELKNAPKTTVQGEYSYANFLDYLQGQVTNSAYAGLANQARAEYNKQSAYNVSNPASYENALAAVRILRGVNNARKAAGLPELYINPFLNYESHVQVEASRPRIASGTGNPHTNIYNANENLAWGYSGFGPESAVKIWQDEKSLYQDLARRRGLTTDETQLDANALFTQLGADFYPVGHYLQNMSNKFNVATTAFHSAGNISQISFKTVANLQELLQAGVVMTVDQYEAKLREFAAALKSGVSSSASKLQAELNVLKAQRTGAQSHLDLATAELNSLTSSKAGDTMAVVSAQASLNSARAALTQAQTKLDQQEKQYELAYQSIASSVAPLQGALKEKEVKLAEAKLTLAHLENAYKIAQEKTQLAEARLKQADEKVTKAIQHISDLENAPENLKKAEANLKFVQEEKAKLETVYQAEMDKLANLEMAHTKLSAIYEELQAKYNLLHPENKIHHPGLAAMAPMAYRGKASEIRSLSGAASSKQALLPSTGTNQNDLLMLAGMVLGGVSLVAGVKRKED